MTTRSAPGQNVNTRKTKAMNKIIELSKPMVNRYFEGLCFKRFLCLILSKADNAKAFWDANKTEACTGSKS